MGDDGIGPAVVRYLSSNYTLPPTPPSKTSAPPPSTSPPTSPATTASSSSTPSLWTLPPEPSTSSRATRSPPSPPASASAPRATINDALIVIDFAGTAPREVVLVGVVPETLEGGMALSPRVAGAVPGVAGAVWREVARRADADNSQPTSPRSTSRQPAIPLLIL
jgi:hypothetical protein